MQVGEVLRQPEVGLTTPQKVFLRYLHSGGNIQIGGEPRLWKVRTRYPDCPGVSAYLDPRQTIGNVAMRDVMIGIYRELIDKSGVQVSGVTGVETGAVSIASWVAQELRVPMELASEQPFAKVFGEPRTDADIGNGKLSPHEAPLHPIIAARPKSKLILVEDTVSTSESLETTALKFGGRIDHAFTLFNWGIGGEQSLARHGITLHTAIPAEPMLRFLLDDRRIPQDDYDMVREQLAQMKAFLDKVSPLN